MGFKTEKELYEFVHNGKVETDFYPEGNLLYEAHKCPKCNEWHNRIGTDICANCQ